MLLNAGQENTWLHPSLSQCVRAPSSLPSSLWLQHQHQPGTSRHGEGPQIPGTCPSCTALSWGRRALNNTDAVPVCVRDVTHHACSSSAPLPAPARPGCPGRCCGSSRTRPAAPDPEESSGDRQTDGGVGMGRLYLHSQPVTVDPAGRPPPLKDPAAIRSCRRSWEEGDNW